MGKLYSVLNVIDYILAVCGIVFGMLEWFGIQHTIPVAVGFLWLAVAFSAMDRISQRK